MKKIKLKLSVLFGTLFAFLMVSCGEKPHVHNLVEHDRKDATCMEDGYEAYVECTTCDYTTYKVIKAKGHDFESNWSSDSEKHFHKCKNCDAKTDESNHTYSWVIDKEATEDETGLKHRDCDICHRISNENTKINKLQHTHNMEHVLKVEKTCTSDGNIEYYHCTKCNKNYVDEKGNKRIEDVVIKASHEYGNFINEVASTCTSEGIKGHYECSVCHTYFDVEKNKLDSLAIAKKDHDYKWIIDKEATEDETGLKHEECSVCHDKKNENTIIVKLNHTHNMEHVLKVDKTCTSNGNIEYYHCSKCNKNYLDEVGNNEVIDVVIKASHEYGSFINEVASTCSKEGIKGHYECNVCHSYFDANKNKLDSLVIAKKNHDYKITYSYSESKHYYECKNCNAKKDEENHSFTWIVDKEATEDETGLKHEECNVCHYTRNENTVIDKANHIHNMEHIFKVDKTCTRNGNIEYYHCSKCNKNYLDETGTNEVTDVVIKASHEYGSFINEIDSTCSKEGIKGHYECNVCHSYFDANKKQLNSIIINKKSHSLVHHDKKEATCIEDGYEEYDTCRNCDYTTFKTIKATGHNYQKENKIENGITKVIYKCSKCGDSYEEGCRVLDSDDFTINYKDYLYPTIEITVHNNETSIVLSSLIKVSPNCTWILSKDIEGLQEIKTKNMSLSTGHNYAYVTVWSNNNEYNTVYYVDIYRLSMYTYSFVDGKQKILKSETVEENTIIDEPNFYLLKEGYTLSWVDKNKNIVSFPYVLKNDITFSVNWVINKYNVKLDTNGGNHLNDLSVNYGSTITLPTPKNGDLVFVGWECNDRLYNKIEVKKDISLKAIWTKDFEVRLLDDGTIEVVKYIGNNKKVNEFPKYTTSIGISAFKGCIDLTSIEIPSNVTNIAKGAFSGCSSLTCIRIPYLGGSKDSNTYLGYIFGASSYSSNSSYVPSSLKEVKILEGCTSIEKDAFSYCSSLASIKIPTSVISIGYSAFENCSSLTSIEIPSNVTSIERYAFSGCSSLTIYCEATSKPSGWADYWNVSGCPVIWNYKKEGGDNL